MSRVFYIEHNYDTHYKSKFYNGKRKRQTVGSRTPGGNNGKVKWECNGKFCSRTGSHKVWGW